MLGFLIFEALRGLELLRATSVSSNNPASPSTRTDTFDSRRNEIPTRLDEYCRDSNRSRPRDQIPSTILPWDPFRIRIPNLSCHLRSCTRGSLFGHIFRSGQNVRGGRTHLSGHLDLGVI